MTRWAVSGGREAVSHPLLRGSIPRRSNHETETPAGGRRVQDRRGG